MDEMFVAVKGQGATMNGKKIQKSDTAELINALIVTGFPTSRAKMTNRLDTNLPYFEEMLMSARDCRRNGSAALDLCYVAAGRQDLFWEMGLKAWDVAAGGLILEEAGGKYSTMKGQAISYDQAKSENDKFNIFGSNGHLHQAVIDKFAQVDTAFAAAGKEEKEAEEKNPEPEGN
jgi:myo-inositol-1(or 4)-monophosphatase